MGRSGGVGSNFEDGAVGSSGRSSRRRLRCMGYALPFVSYGIVDILLDEEHLLDDAPLRQHLQRVDNCPDKTMWLDSNLMIVHPEVYQRALSLPSEASMICSASACRFFSMACFGQAVEAAGWIRLTPADDGRRSRLRDQRRRVKTVAQWEDGGASFSRVRRSSRPTRSRCKTA